MKVTLAISAFVAGTLAQYQTEDPEPTGPAYFGVMSTRSASPVHLLPLTARAGKFYLGGPGPTSYCPEPVQDACPPGNQTVLAGGYGTLSLAVVVPGGQQVYVAPDGTLSYTPPHSAYIPDGSVTNGWSRTEGETFGSLSFEGGLVACPAGEGRGYQVFGQINNVTLGDECLGFNALTINATDPGAWEY